MLSPSNCANASWGPSRAGRGPVASARTAGSRLAHCTNSTRWGTSPVNSDYHTTVAPEAKKSSRIDTRVPVLRPLRDRPRRHGPIEERKMEENTKSDETSATSTIVEVLD